MVFGKTSTKQDIVIPVMGATGAGKSFFINTVLKQQIMVVGRDLQSCTSELGFGYVETIAGYPELRGYRIVLVDTPGFDDTHEVDFAILERIATWLKESYKKGAKLGGVIYLQDISAPRFTGTAKRNLQMFRSMCGDDVLDHVVLGTTKWALNVPDSEHRHGQLESEYWKPLIESGANVRRFDNTYKSAWSFVDTIISSRMKNNLNQTVLLIQKELVDKKLTLPETQAARDLRYTLKEVLEIQKKIERLDASGGEEEQEQRRAAREKIDLLMNQLKKLKIPLSRKFRKFFGF